WTSLRVGTERSVALAAASFLPPKGATKMLAVPFHRQEHALSCEVASLRSALHAIGTSVSEDILVGALAVDPTPKSVRTFRQAQGGLSGSRGVGFTWGDPNRGFVGDIDGRMPKSGYGVHAGPIADLASLYASTTRIRSNDARSLVRAIDAGYPVIAWSVLGSRPQRLSWSKPDGGRVNAAMYEHTVVVTGYRGTAEKIERVYLVDPLTGLRSETWKEFTWRTGFLDHQALVIVPWDKSNDGTE
ncbi:MAG TPA: C39 family peptidase, partial [Candidatus Methylomirabilis sp.]|nr:C39 family peptidase [Candidatus Methylomirabilis sp.]